MSQTSIPEALEQIWLRELTREWQRYNYEYLREALSPPQFEFSREAEATLGSWDAVQRRIRISLQHIVDAPWHEVLETLRHEMAHQYAHEILGAHLEQPHGAAFRKAAHLLRVDAAATAKITSSTDGQDASAPKIIATVHKLLSLGTSSNENEAAAAMRKAHLLLAKHKLELADLEQREGFARHVLGPIKGRHHAWEYSRSALLVEFFFVEAIWIPSYDARRQQRGSLLEIHGRKADCEFAAWVHDWLEDMLPRWWAEYCQRKNLRGTRERLRYFDGLVRGFHDKLKRERKTLHEERSLVPCGDPELEAQFHWLYPRVRTRTTQFNPSAAYEDGKLDGANKSLERPLPEQSASASTKPRALPGS